MLRLLVSYPKKLLDWCYNFEVPEVDEPRSIVLKQCEANLVERKRHQLLSQRSKSLISWIKFQRTLRPGLTGNKTLILYFFLYTAIQIFWINLYHPSFELRFLSLCPWILFELWHLIINKTKIFFNVDKDELAEEYCYREKYLNDLSSKA